ncbi:MAG: aldo/keto reductase, partial [Phycisphaerales bacterium]|nr:aldo/keto reductase [Phycisphaerales bacterium]
GWHRPASNQPLYNMLERHWEAEVFPACRRHGMGIINFSPLAEGLLTGKYLDGVPAGSRAADENLGKFIANRMTDENLSTIRRLKAVADELGAPMARMALAWCLRRPEVTSTIAGASRPEQITENALAADLYLDDAVMARINSILGG